MSSKDTPSDINLTQASAGLRKLLIGAGWDFNPYKGDPLDVDFSAFILNRDNLTREDEDFIFYNNPQGAALAVKHLGDNRVTTVDNSDNEAILVDLDNLPFDVWRIVFVASIYGGDDRDQSFRDLKSMVVRAENADSGVEIHRHVLTASDMTGVTAVKVAELYRDGVEWHFVTGGEKIPGGLGEIARTYGLLISSTT